MRQTGNLGFVFGIFFFLAAAPVQGEFFQWTDSRGVIHFTDDFYSVPEVLRGSSELMIRKDIELRARFSETPAQAEEPPSEKRPPEATSPPEPEPAHAVQPVIHYNPQSFHIVVVHSTVRRPKEKRCFLPEGCRPTFRPDFNDRRFIHPSAFDRGGSRQYVRRQLFPLARR